LYSYSVVNPVKQELLLENFIGGFDLIFGAVPAGRNQDHQEEQSSKSTAEERSVRHHKARAKERELATTRSELAVCGFSRGVVSPNGPC
jgi:hypothetical protein